MFKPDLPCLPLIEERARNILKEKIRKEYYPFNENTPQYIYNAYKYPDFDFNVFSQVWGSTALGFDEIGGQALTKAYTTVLKEQNSNMFFVFFGERFAYIVKDPNESFIKDFEHHQMRPVYQSVKYDSDDVEVYKLGDDKK